MALAWLLDELGVKGLPEPDEATVGIHQAGFSAMVWGWMTTHFPGEALKNLAA